METLLALLFGLLLAAACYMLLAVAVALTGWRMLRGPGIADRELPHETGVRWSRRP